MQIIRTGSVYLGEVYNIIEYIDGSFLVTNNKEFHGYFLHFEQLIEWIEDFNMDAVIEWSRYNTDTDTILYESMDDMPIT